MDVTPDRKPEERVSSTASTTPPLSIPLLSDSSSEDRGFSSFFGLFGAAESMDESMPTAPRGFGEVDGFVGLGEVRDELSGISGVPGTARALLPAFAAALEAPVHKIGCLAIEPELNEDLKQLVPLFVEEHWEVVMDGSGVSPDVLMCNDGSLKRLGTGCEPKPYLAICSKAAQACKHVRKVKVGDDAKSTQMSLLCRDWRLSTPAKLTEERFVEHVTNLVCRA